MLLLWPFMNIIIIYFIFLTNKHFSHNFSSFFPLSLALSRSSLLRSLFVYFGIEYHSFSLCTQPYACLFRTKFRFFCIFKRNKIYSSSICCFSCIFFFRTASEKKATCNTRYCFQYFPKTQLKAKTSLALAILII